MQEPLPFDQLDFLYTPSSDVAADVRYYTEVLGGTVVFAISSMGTKVAMIKLTQAPPALVLADHLDGSEPILVYRVKDLSRARSELRSRGLSEGTALEIPHGPCYVFHTSSGHRVAIYELTRPEAAEHLEGRRDF